MRRARGFTLIELITVVAIMGILATAAIVTAKAATRNANLSRATFDLALRLGGLKAKAMSDQTDYLFVAVEGANTSQCGWQAPQNCMAYFILSEPQAAWQLNAFDPTSTSTAATNAKYVSSYTMPQGVRFLNPAALPSGVAAPAAPSAPFNAITYFDSTTTSTCGGRTCFAIRFFANGNVRGELASGGQTTSAGYAAALTTDRITETKGASRRGLVIGFPGGIVRTFAN